MERTSRLIGLLKSLQHITSCMDISWKAIFYLITYSEPFKVIHKCEWYILHIILNLHRHGDGGGGSSSGGGCHSSSNSSIEKQQNTHKWKWNMLQTKPVHVTITKQQYTWSTGTKALHPRNNGQLIRKCHKLLSPRVVPPSGGRAQDVSRGPALKICLRLFGRSNSRPTGARRICENVA